MKNILIVILILFETFSLSAQQPAFPGAGGGGMYATGGRGGKVIFVTSLADDDSKGTFRYAVTRKEPRIVVFKVAGTIELTRKISIKYGNLTIAGQSAPSDGICIKNYDVYVEADNVIIRFLRFRLGNTYLDNDNDAFGARDCKNLIVDHCSMSWSVDECASFYNNENFTLQWSIISEALNEAGHVKGAHGYGGIWGGKNASFHHNLLANNLSRNPRFNGWKRSGLHYQNPLDEERVDFRNNVIYNWGDNSSYGGESAGKYNIVGNYYKYGSGTKSSIKYKINQVDIDKDPSLNPPGYGKYFITGNYVSESPDGTKNNWENVKLSEGVDPLQCKAENAFPVTPVREHNAEDAFELVLKYAGASYRRDKVDKRITKEALTGTSTYKGSVTGRAGLVDKPEDVGGYPVYKSGKLPADKDNDGIADCWMKRNYKGKSANDVAESGYTLIEEYLNSLVAGITTKEYQGATIIN